MMKFARRDEALKAARESADGRRILLAWVGGSWLHGDADAQSDLDIRVVTAPDADDLLLRKPVKTSQHIEGDLDVTVVPLSGYATRILKGDPNMLEGLHAPVEMTLVCDPAMFTLLRMADDLTSLRTVDAWLGMARQHMKRLGSGNMEVDAVAKTQAALRREMNCALGAMDDGRFRTIDDKPILRIYRGGACTDPQGRREFDSGMKAIMSQAEELRKHASLRPHPDTGTVEAVEDLVRSVGRDAVLGTQSEG